MVSRDRRREIATLLSEAENKKKESGVVQQGLFQPVRLTLFNINQYMQADDVEGFMDLLRQTHSPIDTWIHDEDENYCTLLMHACEQGAVKIAAALIAAGADPQKTDPDGDTAAAYAVDSDANNVALLNLLREHNVDFNLPNFVKEIVLDRAREYEDDEIVDYLSHLTHGKAPRL